MSPISGAEQLACIGGLSVLSAVAALTAAFGLGRLLGTRRRSA